MDDKKVFCVECRKDVNFVVDMKKATSTLKGVTYNYIGKVAHCADCGSEIYVPEVNDFNLKALYDEYREKNDIISLEKTLEICSKYKIGKRPLSLLLGWGEQTFSRYCDGDVPTKQYSDTLKNIYENPEFYNQILEKNKDNLKSEIAYKKSKAAVEKLFKTSLTEKSKINMVVEYLLDYCGDITPLALQKSLYYIQGFYYAFHDEFLFTEDCQAWVHGPVYPEIYRKYKDYKFDPIKSNIKIDDRIFLSSEIAILRSVVNNICCYSGKILEKFTHSESPWLFARKDLADTEPSSRIIKKEDIGNYFKVIKEKYKIVKPNDIKVYTQTMFEKI